MSVFFFVLTYASAPTEFTGFDLWFLAFLFVVVFGVQILIARIFGRYQILQNLLLAGFATINILYLNLVLNEAFLNLPRYGQFLGLLVALFILFTFMNMMDEKPRIARALPTLFVLATAGVLLPTLFSAEAPPEILTEPGKTSSNNIRLVEFKTKPNVYFISFDSFVPKVLLQKHMGLETTPYHEVLDAHFHRFKNFFADRISTRRSLNSLLALDIEYFDETLENDTYNRFFPGLAPSPLFEVFKHNGYQTTTLFRSGYLGWNKGPHVDNYRIDRVYSKSGVCEFIRTKGIKVFTFLGYCALVKNDRFGSILMGPVVDDNLSGVDFLLNTMRDGLEKGVPQVLVAYVYSPGHTDKAYDHKNAGALKKYKRFYLDRSVETAEYLNRIVTFVAAEDPDAIIFIFGDHGPMLSRSTKVGEDDTFFYQDKFGVYGGIHPPDRCANSFSKPYNEDFMTPVQGAHMIIRCLSGGTDAFLKLEDYHLYEFKTNTHKRYENYLYE